MSDDLISRKVLLEKAKNFFISPEGALRLIESQTTAYDVDKVVNQLKHQAEKYREMGFQADRERNCDFADKCYSRQCAYLHAIKIVKAGGVENGAD